MRFDDVDGVDVVEQIDVVPFRLAEQVRGEVRLGDHDRLVDRLRLVDHVVGLQTLVVQPLHVEDEQLLDLLGRQAGLALGGQAVADEVDGLVELVHRPWRDGVEPMGLAADGDRRDGEHRRSPR